jgi:MFS family permease
VNWTLVGWIGLFAAVVVTRIIARRWVVARWLDDRVSDTEVKVLLFAITFGPILAAGVILAAFSPFPQNLIILAVFTLGLAPAIGMAAATFDYASKYGVKAQLQRQRNGR